LVGRLDWPRLKFWDSLYKNQTLWVITSFLRGGVKKKTLFPIQIHLEIGGNPKKPFYTALIRRFYIFYPPLLPQLFGRTLPYRGGKPLFRGRGPWAYIPPQFLGGPIPNIKPPNFARPPQGEGLLIKKKPPPLGGAAPFFPN